MEKLIKETLDSCIEYIPKLLKAVSNIVYNMQSGNEGEGISLMPNILEGLQWVIEAVHGMQQHGYLINIDIPVMTERLRELQEALEIRDYVLIADIFEYEVSPLLENWLESIRIQDIKVF